MASENRRQLRNPWRQDKCPHGSDRIQPAVDTEGHRPFVVFCKKTFFTVPEWSGQKIDGTFILQPCSANYLRLNSVF
jgi:hypothetical protein